MNKMNEKILELIPEIAQIKDESLRSKVVETYCLAFEEGDFVAEDMDVIPFTLLIEDCPFTYLDHVRAVTKCSIAVAKNMIECFGDKAVINMDYLIAGGILHDVGKLLEYERKDGKIVKSRNGHNLRHPFSGIIIAAKCNIPDEILHMIAMHAKEGNLGKRSTEAIIIHHSDFVNFEPFHH
jgi:putative nucleotidyltransferase with HDIG domain